jgi:hypothetical protein
MAEDQMLIRLKLFHFYQFLVKKESILIGFSKGFFLHGKMVILLQKTVFSQ